MSPDVDVYVQVLDNPIVETVSDSVISNNPWTMFKRSISTLIDLDTFDYISG